MKLQQLLYFQQKIPVPLDWKLPLERAPEVVVPNVVVPNVVFPVTLRVPPIVVLPDVSDTVKLSKVRPPFKVVVPVTVRLSNVPTLVISLFLILNSVPFKFNPVPAV